MNKIAAFFRDYALARALIPIGIALLVFSVLTFGAVDRIKNFSRTDAVVTRAELVEEEYRDSDGTHDAVYRIFVKYTVDGKEYESEYGEFTQYKAGDRVKIVYNPSDPTDIAQPNGFLLPIIIAAAGAAALIGGITQIKGSMVKIN